MILIDDYINSFSKLFHHDKNPWEFTAGLSGIINNQMQQLGNDYIINKDIAIHTTAIIETGAIIKPPVIIGKDCFIGANAYLRGGVYLVESVKIGTGCEIKSSIIFGNSAIAHFNFIGDSIIGSNVNVEAGAVTANHYNERADKQIVVLYDGNLIKINVTKFGSLIGDNCRIGANAVLSPGTLLAKNTVVKRLELVEQIQK